MDPFYDLAFENFRGAKLDKRLQDGWFRSGGYMFSTNYIEKDNSELPVAWLRYDMECLEDRSVVYRIFKRNSSFQYRFTPLIINDELNALFDSYRRTINFNHATSIAEFLSICEIEELGEEEEYRFDTEIVEVRDGKKLIAAGYFDHGANSTAAILNFFDPQYKKYSLGKYLMLLQINRTIELDKRYYYPGYIVKDYPKFDYKLFVSPNFAEFYSYQKQKWQRSSESDGIFNKTGDFKKSVRL
jgi:arginine-tRNA-protein transferase